MRYSKSLFSLAVLGSLCAISCGGARSAGEVRVEEVKPDADPVNILDVAEDTRTITQELLDLEGLSDREARLRLARVLGRIGSVEGQPALLKLAAAKDERVKITAIFSLGLLGDEALDGAEELLLGQLGPDSSTGVVVAALDALARLGGESAVEPVMKLLEDERVEIKEAALRALGIFGGRKIALGGDAAGVIAEQLAHEDDRVRFMASFALYRTAGDESGPADVLESLGKVAAGDESAQVRAYATRAMAKRGGLNKETLYLGLEDSDHAVVSTLISAIGLVEEESRCALVERAVFFAAERLVENPELLDGTFVHVARAALELAPDCSNSNTIRKDVARVYALPGPAPGSERSAGAARIRCLASLVAGHDEVALVACDPRRPYAGKKMLARRVSAHAVQSERDLGILVDQVRDPDPRVAIGALGELGGLSVDPARKAVVDALGDDSVLVVSAALDAIAMNADNFNGAAGLGEGINEVIDRFTPFDHAQAPLVSTVPATAALDHGERVAVLERLAADPRPAVRSGALTAFDGLDDADAPEILPPIRVVRPTDSAEVTRWRSKNATANVITSRGSFQIALDPETAPMTVSSFAFLATEGYFDETEIHRVVPNFVVQAGDPSGTGLGDPGYMLRCEVSSIPYERGTVGMALAGKDTGGSQFFVALSPQPHLDGNYTVFGQVVRGMDVVDLLEEGDSIISVEISLSP